jgi:hypothetical protein
MKYGQLPKEIGVFNVNCKEMMFYQYLPIKMIGDSKLVMEDRLKCFEELIGTICCDFIGVFGLNRFIESYVYVTAKYLYQQNNCAFNRPGWHCDGFMTEDINYVWSDKNPTVFNTTDFKLTQDDKISMSEMEQQANCENDKTYPENTLVRLDQFNVHKVADIQQEGMRAFLKVSISKDKYDLIGNAHNYLLNYDWQMKERNAERNIPQSLTSHTPPIRTN